MQINVYVIAMLITGVAAAWLAIGILRKRSAPGRLEFVLLMLAIAVWSCTQAFEGAAVTHSTKLFWGVASYFGSQASPVLLLLFVLRYSYPGIKLPAWKVALLWVIPSISLLMAATNEWHHLLWASVELRMTWAGISATYAHGPWYWLEVVYAYALIVIAIAIVMRTVLDLPHIYARQSRFVFVGIVTPFALNALYAFAPSALSGLDLTPLAFAVTCTFIMVALFRYPLFDLKPIARNVLFDNMTDLTITLDDGNRIVDLNPVAERTLGLSMREAMGQPAAVYVSRWPALLSILQTANTTLPVETITSELHSDRYYDASVIPLRNHYQHYLGRLLILHDATHRQRMEETLRKRESLLQTLAEATFDLLSAPELRESIPRALHHLGERMDADRVYVFEVHPDAVTGRLLASARHEWVSDGIPGQLDTPRFQSFPLEERYPRWVALLDNGQPVLGHVRDLPAQERTQLEPYAVRSILILPITLHDRFWGFVGFDAIRAEREWTDAEQVVLSVAANTLGAAIDHRHLDETRLAIERQLQDARRLESLGVMAGGIAHHYNNLMTAVMGNLDLALSDLPANSAAYASIKQAAKASQALIALTRQVMAYSGNAHIAPRSTNINDLINQNIELLKSPLNETTTLELHLDSSIPDILIDPSQVIQVILNLIENATDAIGENLGTITLRSGLEAYSSERLNESRLPDKPAAGQFAYLEVSDTGCGMNAETQHRLFDPFFTTKAVGHGLGMSMVSGIVQTHKGAIFLNSEIGKGTTVRLLFPLRSGPQTFNRSVS